MYITLPLPYEEIKKQLSPADKIGIVFCNAGARICGYGGSEGAERLTEKLMKDGFNVVNTTISGNPCNKGLVQQLAKNPIYEDDVDTIVIAGCAGFHVNATSVFPDKKVIKTFTDTYGNAMVHMNTNTIIIIDPYMPALRDLGITEFPSEGLPFSKLLEAYRAKYPEYDLEQYPSW